MVALLSHSLETLESLHSKYPDLTVNPFVKVVLEMYGRRLGMLRTLLLLHATTNPVMVAADTASKQTAQVGSFLLPTAKGTMSTAAAKGGSDTWDWITESVIFVKDVLIAGITSYADDIFHKGAPIISGMITAHDTIEMAGTTGDGRLIFSVGVESIMHNDKFGADSQTKKGLKDAGMNQADLDAIFNCYTPPRKPRRQLRGFSAGQSQLGPVCGGHGTCNTDNATCTCDVGFRVHYGYRPRLTMLTQAKAG
jgi:hypothetical protein